MRNLIRIVYSTAILAGSLTACNTQTPTLTPQNFQIQARSTQTSKPRTVRIVCNTMTLKGSSFVCDNQAPTFKSQINVQALAQALRSQTNKPK